MIAKTQTIARMQTMKSPKIKLTMPDGTVREICDSLGKEPQLTDRLFQIGFSIVERRTPPRRPTLDRDLQNLREAVSIEEDRPEWPTSFHELKKFIVVMDAIIARKRLEAEASR
jgi:hypothetical protein